MAAASPAPRLYATTLGETTNWTTRVHRSGGQNEGKHLESRIGCWGLLEGRRRRAPRRGRRWAQLESDTQIRAVRVSAKVTTQHDLEEDEELKQLYGTFETFEEVLLSNARTTGLAHSLWATIVRPGDTMIDATMGNGHDTLVLCRLIAAVNNAARAEGAAGGCGGGGGEEKGGAGRVLALDIQELALDSTRDKLQQLNMVAACGDHHDSDAANRSELMPGVPDVQLVHGCHSHLADHVVEDDSVSVVCFNLGYLPGSDNKDIVTLRETTLRAIQSALDVIRPGGAVTVVGYTGHQGGWEEVEGVMELASSLDPR